jgi:hypothetical protein
LEKGLDSRFFPKSKVALSKVKFWKKLNILVLHPDSAGEVYICWFD